MDKWDLRFLKAAEEVATWSSEDLAYLAGYIDGEGCFHIQKPPYCKISLSISNTHRPTIEWLKETFGGNFSGRGDKKKEHHRPVYTWMIVSRQLVELIQAVYPYLREKSMQATGILLMDNTTKIPKDGTKLFPEIIEERYRLRNMFMELKHVAT